MLEIPGEEAPTDPGLEARMRQVALDNIARRRARTRQRVLSGVAVVLMAVAIGAWAWRMQTQAEELVYELDDVYMAPRDGMIAAIEKPASSPGNPAQPGKPVGTGKRPPRSPVAGNPSAGGDPLHTVAESGSGAEPTSVKFVAGGGGDDIRVGLGAGSSTTSPLGGVDIAIKHLGAGVLETDDEIKAMAKSVTGAYYPQIETCVQQKLKVNAAFTGGWRATFTIDTEGTTKKVKVTALEAPDSELESCMLRAISSWKFERIAHDFQVAKSFHFSGSDG